MLGHDGPPAGLYRENLVSGAPLQECPLRTVLRRREAGLDRELERYLGLYGVHGADVRLVDGGVLDQPARAVEILTMIAQIWRAAEKKEADVKRQNAE